MNNDSKTSIIDTRQLNVLLALCKPKEKDINQEQEGDRWIELDVSDLLEEEIDIEVDDFIEKSFFDSFNLELFDLEQKLQVCHEEERWLNKIQQNAIKNINENNIPIIDIDWSNM